MNIEAIIKKHEYRSNNTTQRSFTENFPHQSRDTALSQISASSSCKELEFYSLVLVAQILI
jgi:hypothetical protein